MKINRYILLLSAVVLIVAPGQAAIQNAGGTYVDTTVTMDGTKQTLINDIATQLVTAGWTNVAGLFTGTYTSGGSITGSSTQTCTLTAFNNSGSGATATVALTGTNTIAGGTALVITNIGTSFTSAPTSATLGNGTATCSGTATISTTISLSGTTNVLLRSAVTSAGSLQIDIRLKDNAGTCVQIYLEDATSLAEKPASYVTTNGASLNPVNLLVYRIMASKYQALIYSANATTSRQFAWFGMPYLPSLITSTITNAGFLFSNAVSDSDATSRDHIRNSVSQANSSNGQNGNYELMINSAWWEAANSAGGNNQTSNATGPPRFILNGIAGNFVRPAGAAGYQWGNGAVITGDVYVAWGKTVNTDVAQVVGQIYDCFFLADSVALDTTMLFNSQTYRTPTSANAGSSGDYPRGGLWFRSQ